MELLVKIDASEGAEFSADTFAVDEEKDKIRQALLTKQFRHLLL